MTTNYVSGFITVAPDSDAGAGRETAKADSVAGLLYRLLRDRPYELTSDDLLLEVHARRKGIAEADRTAARAAFFAKPQACLRACPLVKQHGWGLHHDWEGRVAMVGVEPQAYRDLASRADLKRVAGMRSRRA